MIQEHEPVLEEQRPIPTLTTELFEDMQVTYAKISQLPDFPDRWCMEACKIFAKQFGLFLVSGHFKLDFFKNRIFPTQSHNWLLAAGGEIIDPTGWQFDKGGLVTPFAENRLAIVRREDPNYKRYIPNAGFIQVFRQKIAAQQ